MDGRKTSNTSARSSTTFRAIIMADIDEEAAAEFEVAAFVVVVPTTAPPAAAAADPFMAIPFMDDALGVADALAGTICAAAP